MRRALFLPFVALVAFAGFLGVRAGQVPSETEIINAMAARYLAEAPAGAKATDCLATAGEGAVRLTVTCTHGNGTAFTYPAGLRGGLVDPTEGPQA